MQGNRACQPFPLHTGRWGARGSIYGKQWISQILKGCFPEYIAAYGSHLADMQALLICALEDTA